MGTTQILAAIAGIILYIGWYRFSKRCPSCHNWNTLKKINREFLAYDTIQSTKIMKETKYSPTGRIINTVEKEVPVQRNVPIYKVTYKCKNCGQQVPRTERGGKFLREAGILIIILIILIGAFSSNKNKSENGNKNVISNQNNSIDTLSNYSKTKVSKVNDNSAKKSSIGDAKSENSNLSSKASSNGDAESGNSVSAQKELENESPNEKLNNAQVISKQTVITTESPEYLKRELAFEMLKRGKDVDEIADSTYLSKSQIRKLRRNIEKK